MNIGIEAERANNNQKTGVEHYAKQLILALSEVDSKNNYILYLRTAPEDWILKLPKNFTYKVLPFPIFWTQIRLSFELFFHPVEVLFIPASALPIFHPKKTIVTIHDLAWKYYPETFTTFTRNFLEASTRFAVNKATNLIAVSESTKKDLVKFYGIDEKKVIVVHHGYEQQLAIDLNEDASSSNQLLPERYILFLSTLQPRKNLEGLIDAFVEYKKRNPQAKEKLVVVGRSGWKYEKILEKINKNQNNVLYLNYVTDQQRFVILKNAKAMVLPSFYEGFGMTILEAFSMKVPVLCSNISSMPEVAGKASEYFDPKNIESITQALEKVLLDPSRGEELIKLGEQRLAEFSWIKCAKQTLNIFSK